MRRRPLAAFHRWVGLGAALWLFLLAVTGSLSVFWREADRWLAPQWYAASAGPALPLSGQIAAAEAAWPGAVARGASLPERPGDPTIVYLRAAGAPERLEASIDPATGRVLGVRGFGEPRLDRLHVAPLVWQAHHDLLLGKTIEGALGALALLWAVTQLAAAMLAFPNRRRWRDSFRPGGRTPAARRFRWHRALGVWALPVTLMLALTGAVFHWPAWTRAALGARADPAAGVAAAWPTARPIGWTRALAAADAAGSVDRIAHDPARGLYLARLYDPRDPGARGQRDLVLDAATGAVLRDRHRVEGGAGDMAVAWAYPLHSGQALGWAGRLAVFAAGVATAVLVTLGVLVWARRLRRPARDAEPVRGAIVPAWAPAE